MVTKATKLLIIILTIIIQLFTSITAYAAQLNISTQRLTGDNIDAATSSVALSKWKQSDYAILVCGEKFSDALSAGLLAKKYNAPMLLTGSNVIPTETLYAINQLKVKNVIIVGDFKDVSDTVEDQLKSLGILVTRIYGQDRYETLVKAAEQLNNVSEIAIVTGEQFTNALSILPIAIKRNMPVVLLHDNVIPSVVLNYINSHKIAKTYIIGSGGSLNNTILTGLSNIEIISGNDKYQINMNIVHRFKSDLNLNTIYLATGDDFGNTVGGAILAGIDSNPLVLAGDDISYTKYFFIDNESNISNINILGSTSEIPYEMVSKIIGISTDSTPISTSAIAKLEFVSKSLTKTGENTATFRYRILDSKGKDITDRIPASELVAVASVGSTISLNPAIGTGTINFSPNSDIYKKIVITLIVESAGKLVTIITQVSKP